MFVVPILPPSDWRLPLWAFRACRSVRGQAALARPIARPASIEPPSPHQLRLLAQVVPPDELLAA